MKERIEPTTKPSCPVCARPLTNTERRIIGTSKIIRGQVLQASKDRLKLCLKAARLGS
jgi:hypothetical protein